MRRLVEGVLEKLTEKDIQRIKVLSASKISLWLKCRMEFFFKYVEHEREKESIYLVFGRSIHTALDKFYKLNYKSAESFAKQWSWNWMREISGDNLRGSKRGGLKLRFILLLATMIAMV